MLLLLCIGVVSAQQRNLSSYLEQAKINSPLIHKNKNNVEIIQLDLQQTERVLKSPVINLESTLLFSPIISQDNQSTTFNLATNNANSYIGYDLGATNGGQYQAYISVTQPIFRKMNYHVYSAKSDIAGKQNDNSMTLTVHELEQLVGYQYILCLKSKMQIKNNEILLKQMDDNLKIMRKLIQVAVYKQSDLMLLEIEKQNLEITNKTDRDNYITDFYDLNLLCGIKDSTQTDIQEIDLPMKIEATTTDSKFLISYKLDSLTIVADQSISELKYKPQLNAYANAGYNTVGIPTFDRFGFSAGLTFSWNIYDGGQRKIERAKSNVNLNTLQFEKNHFITQQEISKAKIISQLKLLQERGLMLEKQLVQYNELYTVYENELAQGLVSVMDFKNLLKDITTKRQEFLLQKMEKQLLVSTYNYWNY